AGTGALLAALDAVQTGRAGLALAAASDCRLGKMGGRTEQLLGDGAAAFLLGREDVAAELVASASLNADFVDQRRPAADRFGRSWEDRWIRDLGHLQLLGQAAQLCLQRCGAAPASISRVIIAGPDARTAAGMLKGWGLPPERLQDNLAAQVGDTGAAWAPMMLAASLEQASEGERILVLGYGSGADALLFETTGRIGQIRRGLGIAGHLARRAPLASYEKYAVFRRLLPLDVGIRGEAMGPTAFSGLWRDRQAILALHGNRCNRCGTPHFPPQRICIHPGCGAVDEHEPYPFAHRQGAVFTYTADSLAFSYDPPAIYGLVDMDGGGRLFLDFTDCRQEELAVGMPVSLTFRRKYLDEQGGVHGYFWKASPVVR
ncbi:MAG: hydroxymethylglutaryl-CoA synthase family protein, partial [Deltaproteobacteria bacterium]|nr:hydroxymethylglutaryl-CoA synthase family protein [Deltaproteobacteria bacterium]